MGVQVSERHVLVTGSSGFIGRTFARHLTEAGWLVTGIDPQPGGYTTSLADARGVFMRDRGRDWHWDLVIHCAAQGANRQAIEASPLDLAVNLELDAGLFSWARRVRPGRVVYISSSAAYPARMQTAELAHKLDENDIGLHPAVPLERPDAVYGWIKLTGEYLAQLALADGLAVTVVRPFSGYGADQSADFPFAALADRVLRREDPLTIWGDGRQVRDFVHADDIVATVMAMHDRELSGPVNIGRGIPVTLAELAMAMCARAGYAPRIEPVPSAPSGVAWRVADVARLHAIRVPEISLEDGIANALAYRARMLAAGMAVGT